jgi:beta-lactamase regulating signal transducer with metallopeptidase domain
MIAILLFSWVAALLVYVAGWGDRARDPRLTVLVLVLLALFPLSMFLPKFGVLPITAERGQGSARFSWDVVMLGMWSLGCLVAMIRLLIAAKAISNWRSRSIMIGNVGKIEIRKLDGLRGPLAVGVIRPVIFVPEDWEEWSDGTRTMILEHEMAHHRRRDPLWRWVAEIACVIHGYNPLVVWISRRLAMQGEFACDAMVLSSGVRPAEYARLLCDFAQEVAPRGPVMAMAVASSLESRVLRMKRPRDKRGNVTVFVLVSLAMALAGLLASLGPQKEYSTQELETRWSADPFPGGN